MEDHYLRTNPARLTILVVVALVSAFMLAGCGSGDGEGEATGASANGAAAAVSSTPAGDAEADTEAKPPASLPKPVFIKRADRICTRGGARIQDLSERYKVKYGMGFGSTPTKQQSEEAVVDLVLPVLADEATEISELGAPNGDEAEVAAIVAALRRGVAETREDPSRASSRSNNPLDQAAKLSKAYGFKACGS